ncbi:unnamed protein product [Pleuronectes platessa]|uniref:Uncharacterized protein n=1 Tax=Pleuronectes platessa TaxID=8262 RepID=A0A9N7U8V7_PLEPL|nr:unnamed protein product [Pleuronectes platessa]CAB1432337.1 unnamed protein product [Pleuronectes platessa]
MPEGQSSKASGVDGIADEEGFDSLDKQTECFSPEQNDMDAAMQPDRSPALTLSCGDLAMLPDVPERKGCLIRSCPCSRLQWCTSPRYDLGPLPSAREQRGHRPYRITSGLPQPPSHSAGV